MHPQTITIKYKNTAGEVSVKSKTVDTDLELNFECSIPAGAVNAEIDINIPITTLKAISFSVEKSLKPTQLSTLQVGNITIKTNSTSAPDDTLGITTQTGIAWSVGDTPSNPLTVAVTKLFVSNDGDAVATFRVRGGIDATPVLNA